MWNFYVTVWRCSRLKRHALSRRFRTPRIRPNRFSISKTIMTTSLPNSYMTREYIMKIWGWARLRTTKSISNKCRVWRIRGIKWCTKNIKRRGRSSVSWVSRDRWRPALTMRVLCSGVNTSKNLEKIDIWGLHRWTTSSLWSKKWLVWISSVNSMRSSSRFRITRTKLVISSSTSRSWSANFRRPNKLRGKHSANWNPQCSSPLFLRKRAYFLPLVLKIP